MGRSDREKAEIDTEFVSFRLRIRGSVRGEIVQDEQNPAGRILLTDRLENLNDSFLMEILD